MQGVFFRQSTSQKAQQLSIYGFVRNEPDGSVYIEAEAEDKILNEFIDWCRHGPATARVGKFELSENFFQNFTTFEIRY